MTIVLLQNRGLFVSSPLRTGLTADFWDLWCYLIDWTWIVYIFYSSGFVWMVDFTNSAPFKGVCLSVSLIDLAIPPPFKEVFLSVCWIDLPIAPPFKWVYLSVCWIDCTNNATFQWCLFVVPWVDTVIWSWLYLSAVDVEMSGRNCLVCTHILTSFIYREECRSVPVNVFLI